jgi:hypothetical protein
MVVMQRGSVLLRCVTDRHRSTWTGTNKPAHTRNGYQAGAQAKLLPKLTLNPLGGLSNSRPFLVGTAAMYGTVYAVCGLDRHRIWKVRAERSVQFTFV